jgi:hypothetical protein
MGTSLDDAGDASSKERADSIGPGIERREAAAVTSEVPDRVWRLASAIRAPRGLTSEGLRERFGDLEQVEPAPGQVWRAHWDDVSRLVLLLGNEQRWWRVAPVSIEPTGEDERSLVLDGTRTTFGVEVTVWAGLIRSIPTGTLSRILDEWDEGIAAWCRDTANGRETAPPPGTRRGRPVGGLWETGSSTRATLADELEVLAEAPLVPTLATSTVDLRAAAKAVGLKAVVETLDVAQPEAMAILSRKQPVTAAQAKVLGSLFNMPAEDIAAAAGSLPVDLAVELEQPRWRRTWQRLAGQFGGTEVMARLTAGFGTCGMAYRQTGTSTPDWRARLGQWLSTQPDLESGPPDE